MELPERNHSIQARIDAEHEKANGRPRPHMGCSMLGHPCDRWLWLSFRWAVLPAFPGRVLRLFRRGQNEEETVVGDLRMIGCDISSTGTDQARVNLGCHIMGSIDGIINHGLPGAPHKRHILEIKTHSLKSFTDLEKQGVAKSKPQHLAQMQLYMHGCGVDRALYYAVCKDDDRIHTERVRYCKDDALRLILRGKRLVLSPRLPEPLSTDPSWYQCKFCDAHHFCFETNLAMQANCRTCAHSTPLVDGIWRCERHDADGIPEEYQRTGCDDHVLHPDLVPWQMTPSDDGTEATYIIDGHHVRNGNPAAGCYASSEIIANAPACKSGDAVIAEMRNLLGARIC